MKEVLAIIRPERLFPTLEAVPGIGDGWHTRVMGRGKERGLRYARPRVGDTECVMQFLPKRMLTWVVEDELVEPLVAAIVRANQTSNYGDGRVFVSPLEDAGPAREAVLAAAALGG